MQTVKLEKLSAVDLLLSNIYVQHEKPTTATKKNMKSHRDEKEVKKNTKTKICLCVSATKKG